MKTAAETIAECTFNDDNTAGLVSAVDIGSYTAVFARVFRLTVYNLHGDHSIRMSHGVFILGQFTTLLVPFNLHQQSA